MSLLIQIKENLQNLMTIPEHKAATFFKTGPGEYAAGDRFIGVSVPNLRKLAKKFIFLQWDDIQQLIISEFNEERLLALIILTNQYKIKDQDQKLAIYKFYLSNLNYVNNWNLVDSSAHLIIGAHLWDKERILLEKLALSTNLWERRISIVSTWYFIRKNDLYWTFKISSILLNDKHDLIHKAVGWMLREAGKRDQAMLINFLDQNHYLMPRTMLRYAIEKFPETMRDKYLRKNPKLA